MLIDNHRSLNYNVYSRSMKTIINFWSLEYFKQYSKNKKQQQPQQQQQQQVKTLKRWKYCGQKAFFLEKSVFKNRWIRLDEALNYLL